ncbi:MAG: helix-turn-helix domain-containing protein [Hellea sp.]|nr:helix-turn-helix domain-containing protein [Hellea sp.]
MLKSNHSDSTSNWEFQKVGRILPTKTPLYHQGDEYDLIYRVNSGTVMIFRLLEDSSRQITGFCSAGEFFGLSPDQTYHETAITVGTSSISAFSMADISACADLQAELLSQACSRLEDAQNMMMTLTKKSAAEKIAMFLLTLAKRQSRLSDAEQTPIQINLPMSRLDIADYLGLTIETVSRRLSDLKSKGIIELPSRTTARICQVGKIEQLAGALH